MINSKLDFQFLFVEFLNNQKLFNGHEKRLMLDHRNVPIKFLNFNFYKKVLSESLKNLKIYCQR